ncbi:MAG TPA: hypothetical protein VMN99_00730 [Anaerolineales bacterium]|nr:hypothetical protein [Anaerolineales bacterium]
MDSSFREQGSDTQQDPKRFLVSLTIFTNLINWLVGLIKLTEEEQEEAGIYLDRLRGE